MTVRSILVVDKFGDCDVFASDVSDVHVRTSSGDGCLEVFTCDSEGNEQPLGEFADGGWVKWSYG